MLVAFSVAPASAEGPDAHYHDAVAIAVDLIRRSGLPYHTDAMFTTIEGEWDECMGLVKQCCDALTAISPRVGLVLKADIRPGYTGELQGKLDRLEAAIERKNVG